MSSNVVFKPGPADSIYLRPLFLCHVQAGAPSPAGDDLEGRLDLNSHIFSNPEDTIILRMKGGGFKSQGVFDGDLLIADISVKPNLGQLVVVLINGQQAIKRLSRLGDKLYLTEDTGPCKLIEAEGNNNIKMLAVITFTIHTIKHK